MTKRDLRILLSYVLAIVMIVGTLFVGDVGRVKADSLEISSITVAGNGNGNWLNGITWDPAASSNHMKETSEDVWEITYPCVAAGSYEFKFAANDAWSNGSFGGTNGTDGVREIESGLYYDATTNNGANFKLEVDSKSNITIRLDLREFDGTNGANMIAVVTEVPTLSGEGEAPPTKATLVFETSNVSYNGFENGLIQYGWIIYQYGYFRTTITPLPGFEIDPSTFRLQCKNGDEWVDIDTYTWFIQNYSSPSYDFYIDSDDFASIAGNDIKLKVIVKAVEIDQYPMYVVAGSEALTGANWKGTWVENEDNIMLSEDGKYTKTYSYVQPGNYEFKVVRFDSLNGATWIGNNGNNVEFNVAVPCDVTITYDPSTNGISIKYTYITSLTVAGDGDWSEHGNNWLYANNWRADSENNHMEEVGINSNIWWKVYYEVASGDYEFKIALNDSWDLSLGIDGEMENGVYYDAIRYNNNQASGKCTFSLAEDSETDYTDRYNVFIRVDVSNYDPIAGTGAKIMMMSVKSEEYEGSGGGEGHDGEVVYKLDNLIYSGKDYRKDYGYLSTLYPLSECKLPSSIKIYCEDNPSIVMEEDVHYTYDSTTGKIIIKSADQSYDLLNWQNGSATVIEAEAVPNYPLYLVAGDESLTGSNWNDAKDNNEANHMNKVGNEFVKTYTNVQRGNYSLKVVKYGDENANPTWIGKAGTDANVTFSVGIACDVTVKYNPVTNEITVEGTGLVNYIFEHLSIAGETALFGSDWTPVAMTYSAASDKWEYTLTNVSAGDYLYKYTADLAWTHSWGNEGWYGSSVNYPLSVEYDGSTVVFKVDLSGVDMLNPSSARLTNTEVEIIKPVYDVTFDLDSKITKTGNDTVTAGDVYTATLNVASGFNLPSDKSGIIITVNGSRLSEQYYEYNSTTGIISIQSGVITGDVDIAVSASHVLPDEYDVIPPADNNINIVGDLTATEGEEYSMILTPETGYVLPQSIIIKIGGVETDDYIYNKETGKITILGDKVNGEIEVIAVAQVLDDETTEEGATGQNGNNAKPGDSANSKLVVFMFMAAMGALVLMFSYKKRTIIE